MTNTIKFTTPSGIRINISNEGYKYANIEIWEDEEGYPFLKVTYWMPWYHNGENQGDGGEYPLTMKGYLEARNERFLTEAQISREMENEEDWHFV